MTATGHPGRIDGLRGAIKNGLMTASGSAVAGARAQGAVAARLARARRAVALPSSRS